MSRHKFVVDSQNRTDSTMHRKWILASYRDNRVTPQPLRQMRDYPPQPFPSNVLKKTALITYADIERHGGLTTDTFFIVHPSSEVFTPLRERGMVVWYQWALQHSWRAPCHMLIVRFFLCLGTCSFASHHSDHAMLATISWGQCTVLTPICLLSCGPHRGDSELVFKIPVSCSIDYNI